MKRIPKSVWFLVVLAVLYGSAKLIWRQAYPSGSWRYKMTVVVQTPEGIKTGSAVREVDVSCVFQPCHASFSFRILPPVRL